MLEFDVTELTTHFATTGAHKIYSASPAELGPDAGRITWENCLARAEEFPLFAEDQAEEVRQWVGEFGAWLEKDIADWPLVELNAFVIQEVASQWREFEAAGSWYVYEAHAELGKVRGDLRADADGRIFFSI